MPQPRFRPVFLHRRLLLVPAVCWLTLSSTQFEAFAEEPEAVIDLRQQPADEAVEPFVPKTPRTAEEDDRIEATARYMQGLVQEKRGETEAAFASYQKALELDPEAIEVFRAIIPLAFQLNRMNLAEEYARKAIELDPKDFNILRRLGVFMATRSQVPDAIRLLKQAINSDALEDGNPVRIVLARDLAILYSATGQATEAADYYAILFAAVKNPQKYGLNFTARARLLSDELTSYERMGRVFREAKRFDEAGNALRMALRSRRGKPGTVNYLLADVLFEQKQFADALKELNTYLEAGATDQGAAPYELLGSLYDKLGRGTETLPRLEKLAEAQPENTELAYHLAETYIERKRLDAAETLYRQMLERDGSARGYRGLARLHRFRANASDYIETLAQAVPRTLDLEDVRDELEAAGKDPEFAKALVAWGEDREERTIRETFLLGVIASEAELTDEATKLLTAALDQARPSQVSEVYAQLGTHLLLNESYADAADIFRRAADDPVLRDDRITNLYRLSQALTYAGKIDKALDTIREARREREHPFLQFQEGWIYYYAGQYDNAIRVFERVIRTSEGFQEIRRQAQFTLSSAYVKKGDRERGEQILEDVLAEDPDDPGVNNDLGYLYAEEGKQLERALGMIRKALSAQPENGAYLDSMAWVLYQLKRYEEALTYIRKASETEMGEDATIQDHLGDILYALDRKEEALEAWKEGLRLGRKEAFPERELLDALEEKIRKAEGKTPESELPPPPPLPE